jgi:RAC serine/threonine-protein kinase
MEYVNGKDLSTYLEDLSECQSCYYGAEITMAIQFLHELGFTYGDLKVSKLILLFECFHDYTLLS